MDKMKPNAKMTYRAVTMSAINALVGVGLRLLLSVVKRERGCKKVSEDMQGCEGMIQG